MDPNWREEEKRNRKAILIICGVALVFLLVLGYFIF